MKTVVIEAKMSGTGTIHDTASEHFDREIDFPEGHEYAIVLAAYYGNNIYYTCETADDAIEKSYEQKEYSHIIIDSDGDHYIADGDRLRPA